MRRKVAGDREPRLDVWKKIDATQHSVLILLDERVLLPWIHALLRVKQAHFSSQRHDVKSSQLNH